MVWYIYEVDSWKVIDRIFFNLVNKTVELEKLYKTVGEQKKDGE